MTGGVYASWSIKGNVVIQVTQRNNPHAVAAGVFFDPASASIASSASSTAGYFTANLDATYSYNSLGQVTSVQFPLASWSASAAATAVGNTATRTYDEVN